MAARRPVRVTATGRKRQARHGSLASLFLLCLAEGKESVLTALRSLNGITQNQIVYYGGEIDEGNNRRLYRDACERDALQTMTIAQITNTTEDEMRAALIKGGYL